MAVTEEPDVLQCINPATGVAYASHPATPADSVPHVVEDVRHAAVDWAASPPSARVAAIAAFLDDLARHGEGVAAAIGAATGKPPATCLDELLVVAMAGRHVVGHAAGWLAEEVRYDAIAPGRRAIVRRVPLGVVAVLGAYNFPFNLSLVPALSAAAAGNGVVIKVSEVVVGVGVAIESALAEWGGGALAPIIRVVHGGAAVGRALTDTVDHAVFVGSVRVGRAVAAAMAARGKGATLELGGKDPALVVDTDAAAIASAAAGVARGAFYNGGQMCVGIERCYVVAPAFDAFVDTLVKDVRTRVKAGHAPPPAPGAHPGGVDAFTYGPAICHRQLVHIEAAVTEAIAAGATLHTGGRRTLDGRCYEPTVLTLPSVEAAKGLKLMAEETFGPVLPIIPVPDEDAAVAAANDSPFGLGAYVWCSDLVRAEAIGRRLRCGGVVTNETVLQAVISSVPFGGVGISGLGRVGGREGCLGMTTTNTVIVGRGQTSVEKAWLANYSVKWRLLRAMYGGRWAAVGAIWETIRHGWAVFRRWWRGERTKGKSD
ncbi:hypothetical protein MMPV_001274 [Pyropia vietnamensis]